MSPIQNLPESLGHCGVALGARRCGAMPSSRLAFSSVLALAVSGAAQDKGQALRGLVFDLVLHPIPAATVEARDAITHKLVGAAKTDGSGLFVLGRLPRRQLIVAATADGHGWLREEIDFRGGLQPRGLQFLVPDAGTLAGVVDGPGKRPVEGAWVVAGSRDRTHSSETQTGPDGRFELTKVPLGELRVHVFRAGMKPLERKLYFRGSNATNLTLDLQPGGRGDIRVDVQGIRNSRQRERIGVSLRWFRDGRYQVLPRGLAERTLTDWDSCRFRGLPPGAYTVSARSSDRAIEPRYPTVVLGAGENARQTFRLIHPAAVSVQGTVTDPMGCPLSNVTVRASHPYWAQRGMPAATNRKGEFVLVLPFPPGEQFRVGIHDRRWVLVGEPFRGHVPRSTEEASRVKIALRAVQAASIAGRVFDGKGRPLAWATVRLGRRTACTATDGSYVFHCLPPGEQPVLTVDDPRVAASREVDPLQPGQSLCDIHLIPTAPGDLGDKLPVHEVVGIVTDLDARPLAGAEIWIGVATARVWEPLRTARSNRRGEFRLTSIPAGEYVLWGEAGVGIKGSSERFEVKDGGLSPLVTLRINRR